MPEHPPSVDGASAVSAGEPAKPVSRLLTGWGRTAPTAATVVAPPDDDALDALLEHAGHRGVVARGLGRSYGDAAQNAGGNVVDGTAFDSVRDLDLAAGTARVDAG